MIEVRIGVSDSRREIVLEIEEEADVVRKTIEGAIEGEGTLWLTDRKGTQLGIPIAKLAYVEISPQSARPVGFASR